MAILRKIFWVLATRNICLRAVWIPSEANPAADAGSRLRFDLLQALTGLKPSQVSLSGPLTPHASCLDFAPPLPLIPLLTSKPFYPSKRTGLPPPASMHP